MGLPSLNERKVSAPPPSTSHSGSTLGGGGTGNGGGLRRSTVVARSPSSAKEVILPWVQERTNTYPNLKVTNFSSSWNSSANSLSDIPLPLFVILCVVLPAR